jgi:hypothetical protein
MYIPALIVNAVVGVSYDRTCVRLKSVCLLVSCSFCRRPARRHRTCYAQMYCNIVYISYRCVSSYIILRHTTNENTISNIFVHPANTS